MTELTEHPDRKVEALLRLAESWAAKDESPDGVAQPVGGVIRALVAQIMKDAARVGLAEQKLEWLKIWHSPFGPSGVRWDGMDGSKAWCQTCGEEWPCEQGAILHGLQPSEPSLAFPEELLHREEAQS